MLTAKLRKAWGEQIAKEETKADEPKDMMDLIRNIADGYISDLRLEDIPDSACSDVEINTNEKNNEEHKNPMGTNIDAALEEEVQGKEREAEEIERANYDFMRDFV